MGNIEREWGEVGGRRYLYARPRISVNNDEWVGFFETELDGFSDDVFHLLADVTGVDEDVGIDGFFRFAELLVGLHVRRVRIAILPANEFYTSITNLFREVTSSRGLDVKVKICHQRSAAEAWLAEQ